MFGAQYDAQPWRADIYPLTPLGEVDALVRGLKTWWIIAGYIYKRTREAIQVSPYGTGGIIVRTHKCGMPPPDRKHIAVAESYPEEPPF